MKKYETEGSRSKMERDPFYAIGEKYGEVGGKDQIALRKEKIDIRKRVETNWDIW